MSRIKLEGVLFLLIIGLLISMPLLRVSALSTNYFDLGIFITNFVNISNTPQLFLEGHLHPLMLIWGAVFSVTGPMLGTYIVIFTQGATIALAVVLLRRHFGRLTGWVALLYYPLWVNALFDFHFDHLAILLLTLFFIYIDKGLFSRALMTAFLLPLIKEPFALQSFFCALYVLQKIWSDRNTTTLNKKNVLTACVLLFFSCLYFAFFYFFISPISSDGFNYAPIDNGPYSWILTDFRPEKIYEILTNPLKLKFIIVVFGLLLFIPLLCPKPLLVAVGSFLMAMLAGNDSTYFSYANHYTAPLIIPLIVAFHGGCQKLSKMHLVGRVWQSSLKGPTLVIPIFIGFSLFASFPTGRLFWSDKVHEYNWRTYVRSDRSAMIERKLISLIPDSKDVVVSTQNNLNHWHLANRKSYLPFPAGILEPYKKYDWADRKNISVSSDFVVLDLKRPLFINDRGCDWLYGGCKDMSVEKDIKNITDMMLKTFKILFSEDDFYIYERIK